MTLAVEDKIEIQELASKYAIAMDMEDIDAWLATWAGHGVWQGGIGRYEGLEKLRELFTDLGDRIRNKRHVMTNFVIEGSGTSASLLCYLMIVDIAKHGPPGTAVYEDRLEKIQGRWKFVERSVKIDQPVKLMQ